MSTKIYWKATNYQAIISSFVLIIIGFLLLYFSKDPYIPPTLDLVLPVVGELGSILVATGIVAFLWELYAKRSFFEEIMAKIRLAEQVQNAGLVTITAGSYREIDWPGLFKNVKELDMCFAYARTWRHINTLYLQDLALKSDANVRVIVPDPENADVMRELSRRFETTPDELKNRVNEAISEFNSIFRDCKARYSLWYLMTTPLFSFYRFDDTTIIALHKHGKNRGQIPVFQVNRGGDLYKFAENELNTILDEKNGLARPITNL
jgi:hypothetical protein